MTVRRTSGAVLGERESVPELGDLFLVPTLRVQVLGKDQREHEMKREGETRTGLGSGVWGLVRAEERKHETRKLGQTSGTRQSPFSREGDLGFLTSILLTLTSDPPRERSELSIFLITLHSPRFSRGLSTMLSLGFLRFTNNPQPTRFLGFSPSCERKVPLLKEESNQLFLCYTKMVCDFQ